MSDFSVLLRSSFDTLNIWPNVSVNDITDVDAYYSDGASCGAIFKVIVYKDVDRLLGISYVFSDGRFTLLAEKDYNELFAGCVAAASHKWQAAA